MEWSQAGGFNVVIESYPGNGVWSVKDDSVVHLDLTSGAVTREISLNDIHLANPDIAVFTPRRSLRVSKWYHDPVHLNDVEPLRPALADSFPMFAAGDLLLSYRSLNLIAVVDPQTRVIKWWRSGISLRQYDVDWERDGTISIYDNNRRENRNSTDNRLTDLETRYSRILKIDPASMDVSVIFDGKQENFYNAKHGKHQVLPDGNILISSPEQGRFFEVNREGQTVFEFVNLYDESQVLKVSEAKWLPLDFFSVDFGDDLSCD